jgi:hypothetical protein
MAGLRPWAGRPAPRPGFRRLARASRSSLPECKMSKNRRRLVRHSFNDGGSATHGRIIPLIHVLAIFFLHYISLVLVLSHERLHCFESGRPRPGGRRGASRPRPLGPFRPRPHGQDCPAAPQRNPHPACGHPLPPGGRGQGEGFPSPFFPPLQNVKEQALPRLARQNNTTFKCFCKIFLASFFPCAILFP